MVKPRLHDTDDADSQNAALWTLKNVLLNALKLLHPYMPFVTEEIFCNLQDEEESIMISSWPQYREDWNFPKEEEEITIIKEAVRGIRNVRSSMNAVSYTHLSAILCREGPSAACLAYSPERDAPPSTAPPERSTGMPCTRPYLRATSAWR